MESKKTARNLDFADLAMANTRRKRRGILV